jgi:hypothetical protein
MKIDIDDELAARPLTRREKIALYILLCAFWYIVPAKYSHQVEKALAEVKALITGAAE